MQGALIDAASLVAPWPAAKGKSWQAVTTTTYRLQANVVAPNKHTSSIENMYGGRLLESETYIGGKVEALESGEGSWRSNAGP